jgi:hypothetical protein
MRWLSAAVLVAVNAIPLIGVALWDWSLMMILVLYWVESGIVGVVNVFKIARASGPVNLAAGGTRITFRVNGVASGMARGAIIGFFILHYGIFWLVHGVFVFLLPVFAGLSMVGRAGSGFGPPTSGRCRSTRCCSRLWRWRSATG